LIGQRTFVPLRAMSEALGKQVFYDRGLIVIGPKADLLAAGTDKAEVASHLKNVADLCRELNTRWLQVTHWENGWKI